MVAAGVGTWRLLSDPGTTQVVLDGSSTTITSVAPQPGQLVIELVDPPIFIEGFDVAVRVTPRGDATVERQLEEFTPGSGGTADVGPSSSSTFEVPSGRVTAQAHLTIGQGPGPREPDFVDHFDGSLCTAVDIEVPAGSAATARMDWKTGCLESDDAVPPTPSDLLPRRPPDASGVTNGPFPGDTDRRIRFQASTGQDDTFDGALLNLTGAVVVDADGGVRPDLPIARGTRLDVWFGDCRDTSPLQCDVEAIRLRR
jgi:hypothetical protein